MLTENLKRIRKKAKISQAELAKKLQISQQGYANYETGKATPDPERLAEIAKILNCDIEDLICNTEETEGSNITNIIITKKYRKTRNSIIISGENTIVHTYGIVNDSTEENDEYEPEGYFHAPKANPEDELTFEEIYAETYVDYLKKFENIQIPRIIESTILNKLDETFTECREIYTNPDKFYENLINNDIDARRLVQSAYNIKYLRTKHQLTQQELADRLGITVDKVSKYENCIKEPDTQTVLKFVKRFEVTADYVLGLTNQKPINEILKSEAQQEAKFAARDGSQVDTRLTEEEIQEFQERRKKAKDK